jgi:hypothetical protein
MIHERKSGRARRWNRQQQTQKNNLNRNSQLRHLIHRFKLYWIHNTPPDTVHQKILQSDGLSFLTIVCDGFRASVSFTIECPAALAKKTYHCPHPEGLQQAGGSGGQADMS